MPTSRGSGTPAVPLHGDHDPCPLADKALFPHAMMCLIIRKEGALPRPRQQPVRSGCGGAARETGRTGRPQTALPAILAANFTFPGGEISWAGIACAAT